MVWPIVLRHINHDGWGPGGKNAVLLGFFKVQANDSFSQLNDQKKIIMVQIEQIDCKCVVRELVLHFCDPG